MTFPPSERVVYAAHTLASVACELQFPPVLTIGTEAPARFQEAIRQAYPLYSRVEAPGTPPELARLIAQLPINPFASLTHQFSTADGKRTVSLAPNMLSLNETDYDEWPTFRAQFASAKDAAEDEYHPAFYTRIGLRYQDVIDRRKVALADQAWADLLNPTLTGWLGSAEATIREGVVEVMGNALIALDGAAGANVRIVHGLARTADDPEVIYLIDADYFVEGQKSGDEALELMDYFNREAGQLFRWAITDTLRDALGRRDLVARPH